MGVRVPGRGELGGRGGQDLSLADEGGVFVSDEPSHIPRIVEMMLMPIVIEL